jgi:hypothetical protein
MKVQVDNTETHKITPQGDADYITLDNQLVKGFCLDGEKSFLILSYDKTIYQRAELLRQ